MKMLTRIAIELTGEKEGYLEISVTLTELENIRAKGINFAYVL